MRTDRLNEVVEAHDEEKLVDVKKARTGLGVFAARRFEPGEVIGCVQGELVDDPDYESDCCIFVSPAVSLEPAAPFRYLNHACQPNCDLALDEEAEDGPTVWVEALAAIEPGEELRIDYGWPASAAIPCDCGSPECRGWIVARQEITLLDPAR